MTLPIHPSSSGVVSGQEIFSTAPTDSAFSPWLSVFEA